MKNTFILFLVALSFVCSSCNRTPSVEEPDVQNLESTGFRGYYLYIDSGLSHLQAYHVDGF